MTIPLYPPPAKNPYRMPLIITTFDLATEQVKSYTFGKEANWEKRWDKFTDRHPDKFCTLWSPFFDREAGHVAYLKLICDCKQYAKDVDAFDWNALVEQAKANVEEEDGQLIGTAYIGSVFQIMPSGKYYMPWAASNVTEDEAARDEIFMEHLEGAASASGGGITTGEGDPCDLYFEMVFPLPEETEEEDAT